MSLANSLARLPETKINQVDMTIVETGLALFGGGKPYAYLMKKKNKAISPTEKKTYTDMNNASIERLTAMVDAYLSEYYTRRK